MFAQTRATFRVSVLGGRNLRIAPGTLVVATHRTDDDVPIFCGALFSRWLWRFGRQPHYAARDDLFERGALVGMAPRLPQPISRLLWRVSPEAGLRRVKVHPLRIEAPCVVQVLRAADPSTSLEDLLPAVAVDALRARADALGVGSVRSAGDAMRRELADVLWRPLPPDDADPPHLRQFRAARSRAGATDLRHLMGFLGAGEPLLLFPEGGLSVDGSIGPLRPGAAMLVRRAQPRSVIPVALAYDTLVTGRRRVVLSVGPAVGIEPGHEDRDILGALRRGMPLTCGQVVAREVLRRDGSGLPQREELERAVIDEVRRARRERRPVDPDLARPASRQRRIADALAALAALAAVPGDQTVRRLAREYDSARESD
jgi:1-acyl-sn-glycerol-3-phosphate acyltransferase